MMATFILAATCRTLALPGWFFITTMAFAGRSSNSKASSASVRAQLSGAYTHESERTKKADAASGPLGSAEHSRSVRPIPRPASICGDASISAALSQVAAS